MAAERFGVQEERGGKQPYTRNQGAGKGHTIRNELKSLTKQFKEAREEEQAPLAELRLMLRKRLLTLHRAENNQRCRWERAWKRAAFINGPFGFTRQLLRQRRSGHLACAKEEFDHLLQDIYSDPTRDQDQNQGECEEPTQQLDLREPLLKEIQHVVKKARSSSAPGPSGTSYKVYKHCPRLLLRLWRIIRVIWRRGKVAQQWRC